MSKIEIGCCGAYCRTCLLSTSGSTCHGCKLGYEDGQRDINKARCQIKLCCYKARQFETCADCDDFPNCNIIQGFYKKNGYKYKKYRQSIEYIVEYGYSKFMIVADSWKGPYGNLR